MVTVHRTRGAPLVHTLRTITLDIDADVQRSLRI